MSWHTHTLCVECVYWGLNLRPGKCSATEIHLQTLPLLFEFLFWDKVLPNSSSWPWTWDSPALLSGIAWDTNWCFPNSFRLGLVLLFERVWPWTQGRLGGQVKARYWQEGNFNGKLLNEKMELLLLKSCCKTSREADLGWFAWGS